MVVRAAYDTRIGLEPNQPSTRTAVAAVGCRSRANSVGAVRYADSGRWRWSATHTLTRGRACASRGGSHGVHAVDLCRSLYLLGTLSGTITNGGCSPPLSAGPWSERQAGSVGPEPGGPAGRRGAVETGCVRVRKVARGRSWPWGRARVCPSRSRAPGGPARTMGT
jgi:hypothetical protein